MDGVQGEVRGFRSPARILIPKLVVGRDRWKEKAGERKRRLKSLQIRIRDLEGSRELWRERAEAAERRAAELERAAAAASKELAALRDESSALRDELKKS
jgi:chromosome segregation ATPase